MQDNIARYTEALARNPENNLARFSLAKALFDGQSFAAARDHFAVATELKPDWMAAQILLGKSELELGNRSAAIEAFLKARHLAETQHHDGPLMEVEQMLHDLGTS